MQPDDSISQYTTTPRMRKPHVPSSRQHHRSEDDQQLPSPSSRSRSRRSTRRSDRSGIDHTVNDYEEARISKTKVDSGSLNEKVRPASRSTVRSTVEESRARDKQEDIIEQPSEKADNGSQIGLNPMPVRPKKAAGDREPQEKKASLGSKKGKSRPHVKGWTRPPIRDKGKEKLGAGSTTQTESSGISSRSEDLFRGLIGVRGSSRVSLGIKVNHNRDLKRSDSRSDAAQPSRHREKNKR